MENEKKNHRASFTSPTVIAETVYDPDTKTTKFALYEAGEVRYADSAPSEYGEVLPLSPRTGIVRKGVILLPSSASEYGSDQELLHEIQAWIHKWVDVSPSFERIAAQYVFLSWLHDRVNELPYLRVRGDFGTGKSRFLRVVGELCYRPIFTTAATTTSPIFRLLDEVGGTLILDEADFNNSDAKHDLVKILNSGYQKGMAVMRAEGKDVYESKPFEVYGPKVLATRFNYKDQALESRFLIEDMVRIRPRKGIPSQVDDAFHEEARELRNKLLLWRFRNFRKELTFDETIAEGVHPRLRQIIIPLLAVMPGDDIRQVLVEHVQRHNEELIAARGLSWEYDAILALLRLQAQSHLDGYTVKQIADEASRDAETEDERMRPKKAGWVFRERLQLMSHRTNKGVVISVSKNANRIAFWRERLGITDQDIQGEQVNVVNMYGDSDDGETGPRPEDIRF